ncbi:hypothetical protein N0V83_010521 [Neocucurbitaria cava]|uniref:Uncharacterized protein n=1 Tax=Neocucurbitaria cava TaxID=798079 RepID=A0A9W9CGM0_9PLEO|nr:hypothetical protein N0V83_010521 [Neocucurbitaria cava]
MSDKKPVSMTTDQAQSGISQELRNNIYSALLSYGGIRNIESTLDEVLRREGFKDELRRYITYLFRSGQATSAEQARDLAMEKIREAMQSSKTNGTTNGTNGTSNGTVDGSEDYNLRIPHEAIKAGTRSVQEELDKVCDITCEDE